MAERDHTGRCRLLLLCIHSGHLEILEFPMGGAYQYGLNRTITELSKSSWYPKRKLGVTMHFSEIITLWCNYTLAPSLSACKWVTIFQGLFSLTQFFWG